MRTLKYFGIYAEKMFGTILAFGIGYTILFGVALDVGTSYLLMMGVIMIITCQAGLVKLNLPLVLSFGCNRKEAFMGTQLVNFLLIVQMEIVGLIMQFFSIPAIEGYPFSGILLLTALIGSGAASQFLAGLIIRFQTFGTLIGIGCGLLIGISVSLFMMYQSFSGLEIVENYKGMLVGAAVVLYALAMFFYYKAWKNYELRPF